jgi:serine/threonine-protein kinase
VSIENYGRYQLLKRIATGGMAQIYLARQTGPEGFEKLLVVKRILPHLAENAEFVRMFLDEARIAARLNHPNIVQIFDLGAQDGTYFIAMEYIHGEDVRRVWKHAANRGTQMPIPLVCRVVMDACAGLDYAHKKTDAAGKPLGIVHRDISPQNILVTFEGGVKVVDFGIAKAADQATVTRSGVLKGKYSYMSPEQANGQRLDFRSDIFALGVVLHELLSGQRLFKRANDIQTLHAVTSCEVFPPSEANPEIPTDLDALVMRALAKEPAHRYQDAIQLQVALEDWLIRHRQPSSSAHLAAFMQELYLDRLDREREIGQILVEEASDVPKSSAEEEIRRVPRELGAARLDPSASTNRSTELGAPSPSDLESTLAEPSRRPSRSMDRPRTPEPVRRPLDRAEPPAPRFETNRFVRLEPGEESLAATQTTEADSEPMGEVGGTFTRRRRRRKSRAWLVVVALVALAALGAVGEQLWVRQRGAPRMGASIHISTQPPGATVFLDGRPVPGVKTPCRLPDVTPGAHALWVGLAGYIDHRSAISVPESGELTLPTVQLAPEPPPILPDKAAPRTVVLAVRSQPAGAVIALDGKPRGKTPADLDVPAEGELTLRLELAGYRTVERVVKMGPGRREEMVELEALAKERGDARIREKEREREKEHDKIADRPQGTGKVRFVVSPWAMVTCGTIALGTTPFPDRELPAGTYNCKFTNPDHGTQIRKVEVRPNALEKVLVQF